MRRENSSYRNTEGELRCMRRENSSEEKIVPTEILKVNSGAGACEEKIDRNTEGELRCRRENSFRLRQLKIVLVTTIICEQ